jgi:hypothetical protein
MTTETLANPSPWIISHHELTHMEFALIEIHGRAVLCLASSETTRTEFPDELSAHRAALEYGLDLTTFAIRPAT